MLALDNTSFVSNGIIDQAANVGARVSNGVMMNIALCELFGCRIFLNRSLNMLVKVWKMSIFMYMGSWRMCIQPISLRF